tara:strand:- start:806 stop:1162 length:357 start_codon:yes stop_codon:yes gene_type:complete
MTNEKLTEEENEVEEMDINTRMGLMMIAKSIVDERAQLRQNKEVENIVECPKCDGGGTDFCDCEEEEVEKCIKCGTTEKLRDYHLSWPRPSGIVKTCFPCARIMAKEFVHTMLSTADN